MKQNQAVLFPLIRCSPNALSRRYPEGQTASCFRHGSSHSRPYRQMHKLHICSSYLSSYKYKIHTVLVLSMCGIYSCILHFSNISLTLPTWTWDLVITSDSYRSVTVLIIRWIPLMTVFVTNIIKVLQYFVDMSLF